METKIKQTKEELQKMVNQYQQTQTMLQNLANEIIAKKGYLKALEDLEEENKKKKSGN